MALTITRIGQGESPLTIEAKQRLWQTADRKRLVPEGDPDAAFLYCIPGRRIPIHEARLYGLVEEWPEVPDVKDIEPAETKEIRPQEKKSARKEKKSALGE